MSTVFPTYFALSTFLRSFNWNHRFPPEGVPPKNASCMIDALFLHHSKRGVYYPKGGASEIPYHIIQVLEKHGGKVLVNAPVSSILVDGMQNVYGEFAPLEPKIGSPDHYIFAFSDCIVFFFVWLGVAVKTGGEDVEIRAPVIISNVGMFTTFKKLLPSRYSGKSG